MASSKRNTLSQCNGAFFELANESRFGYGGDVVQLNDSVIIVHQAAAAIGVRSTERPLSYSRRALRRAKVTSQGVVLSGYTSKKARSCRRLLGASAADGGIA